MKVSTEVLLGQARKSLENAGGDVHDSHHADWLLQESIAYSLLAIAQELHELSSMEAQKFLDGPVQRGAGTDESGN